MTPREWKTFYQRERERLGRAALDAMVERAPRVKAPVIFPHTRAEVTGELVAAAARAVIESGADEVLAIGVLHGGTIADEFSLDAFEAFIDGRVRIHAVYPADVGVDDANGDELARLAERMPIVATADMVHHGPGYGDPAEKPCDPRALIDAQLGALARHDWGAFQTECAHARSDFRKSGPILARLLGRDFTHDVHTLTRVDYAEALGAAAWVAGALVTLYPAG